MNEPELLGLELERKYLRLEVRAELDEIRTRHENLVCQHEAIKAKVREFVEVNEKLHYYLDAPAITYEEYCALGDRSEALYQEFKELVK